MLNDYKAFTSFRILKKMGAAIILSDYIQNTKLLTLFLANSFTKKVIAVFMCQRAYTR